MILITTFVFSDFQENTYLLTDETDDAIIIDPGCYTTTEQKEIKSYIETHNLTVKQVLYTHCHLDHAFGSKFLASAYPGVLFSAHKGEEIFLKQSSRYSQAFDMSMEDPPPLNSYINEGDIIRFGASELKALHVPGHSPGSLCFYSAAQKFLIAGDVLFAGSIGRADLPGGDFDSLIDNIHRKILTLPDDVVVYCGHGPTTSIGQERQHNPYLNRT